MLVPYDTCQCCFGSGAHMRKSREILCDECWSFYPEDDLEPEYLDEPPWVDPAQVQPLTRTERFTGPMADSFVA